MHRYFVVDIEGTEIMDDFMALTFEQAIEIADQDFNPDSTLLLAAVER